VQLIAVDAIGGESAIPEAGEHERVWILALREEFRHVDCRFLIVDLKTYASIRWTFRRSKSLTTEGTEVHRGKLEPLRTRRFTKESQETTEWNSWGIFGG
jgi:hypothetical protein